MNEFTFINTWLIICFRPSFANKSKVRLPPTDGVIGEQDDGRNIPTRASTRMSKVTINLPKSSIAAVKGDEAEKFEEYQDEKERVVPLSHAWCPTGDIIIGCAGGQLMQVSNDVNTNNEFHKIIYIG